MYREPQTNQMLTPLDGSLPIDSDSLALQKACPVCGNTEFEWGRLYGQAYYIPGTTSIWSMSRRGYQYLKMRRCLRCNNLISFADPELTRRQSRSTMLVAIIGIAFALLIGLGGMFAATAHAVIR